MATSQKKARDYVDQLLTTEDRADVLRARLRPKAGPAAAEFPRGTLVTGRALEKRWSALGAAPAARPVLLDSCTRESLAQYRRNVENCIGTVRLPVGVAGPLRVNGLFAQGDYFVPLATTEAALVASYHRGSQLITATGGATCVLLSEGVSRAPAFAFENLAQAGEFASWVVRQMDRFQEIAGTTSRYARLNDFQITVEGNHVYLCFEFTTGDAAGQNMVTIASEAICDHILRHAPVAPTRQYVEANFSGDKKASARSFFTVRGKKVTAEARLEARLVERYLHTTPAAMVEYWRMSALGGVMSGTIGVQGHYANGLAALFIACGQDAACVSESAVGVTRFEPAPDGGLYASVTLPNLIVGTVGGGTELPTQRACLEILGLSGAGKARALAEVCAAMALAGELSIIGALCAGDFTRAHRRLARGTRPRPADDRGG